MYICLCIIIYIYVCVGVFVCVCCLFTSTDLCCELQHSKSSHRDFLPMKIEKIQSNPKDLYMTAHTHDHPLPLVSGSALGMFLHEKWLRRSTNQHVDGQKWRNKSRAKMSRAA